MGDIPEFTTRPELIGTFGMVASTHWLASAAGMAVLEHGGKHRGCTWLPAGFSGPRARSAEQAAGFR